MAINAACTEIWSASNIPFGLCPLLTALRHRGARRPWQRGAEKIYLEKLVSGEWTGSPCAATEAAGRPRRRALRTGAERADDGSYRIKGTKIFIPMATTTMTDNTVHFVLGPARRASGHQGDFAVPDSEIHGQCRRLARPP